MSARSPRMGSHAVFQEFLAELENASVKDESRKDVDSSYGEADIAAQDSDREDQIDEEEVHDFIADIVESECSPSEEDVSRPNTKRKSEHGLENRSNHRKSIRRRVEECG